MKYSVIKVKAGVGIFVGRVSIRSVRLNIILTGLIIKGKQSSDTLVNHGRKCKGRISQKLADCKNHENNISPV